MPVNEKSVYRCRHGLVQQADPLCLSRCHLAMSEAHCRKHVGSTASQVPALCGGQLSFCLHVCVCCLCVCAAEGEETVRRKLRSVNDELVERFRQLEEEFR